MTALPPPASIHQADPPPCRVVVVDGSAALRGFLQHTLEGDPRIALVGVSTTLSGALDHTAAAPPHVVVMGVPQGGSHDPEFLEALRAEGAGLVALLAPSESPDTPRARLADALLRRPESTSEAFALAAPLLLTVLRVGQGAMAARAPRPQLRQASRPVLRQPSNLGPRTNTQPQLRQPSRPVLRQSSNLSSRVDAQPQLRQPSNLGPRTNPQPQLRQPSRPVLRQSSNLSSRVDAQPQLRQPSNLGPRTNPQPQLRQASRPTLRQPSHSGRRTPTRAPAPPPSAVYGRPVRFRAGQHESPEQGAGTAQRGEPPRRIPTGVAGRPRRHGSRVRLPHGEAPQVFVSLVVIGASMGGVEAVERVLRMLPAWTPPTLIVQHMPAPFVPPYANRLDGLSAMKVRVATDRTPLRRGVALIAPGDRHLVVERVGAGLEAVPLTGPRVNLHRPAVGVLFDAVARVVGAPAVGVLLTGMGSDGAEGLAHMRQAGARTIAQDEATSVVHGMPGAAISLGAAERIEPLDRVAASILELATEPPPHAGRGEAAAS